MSVAQNRALQFRQGDVGGARVTRAYELFVADGEYVFEQQGEAVRNPGATVALTWVMRSRADGSIAGSGFEILTFGPDG